MNSVPESLIGLQRNWVTFDVYFTSCDVEMTS